MSTDAVATPAAAPAPEKEEPKVASPAKEAEPEKTTEGAEDKPKEDPNMLKSPEKKEDKDSVSAALMNLASGKRNLLVGDIPAAVAALADACQGLGAVYGETGMECGEAYFYYGKALLELARMETGVIQNGMDGVPDESGSECNDDSTVEDPTKVTDEELKEIEEKVGEAIVENAAACKKLQEEIEAKKKGEAKTNGKASPEKMEANGPSSSPLEKGKEKMEEDGKAPLEKGKKASVPVEECAEAKKSSPAKEGDEKRVLVTENGDKKSSPAKENGDAKKSSPAKDKSSPAKVNGDAKKDSPAKENGDKKSSPAKENGDAKKASPAKVNDDAKSPEKMETSPAKENGVEKKKTSPARDKKDGGETKSKKKDESSENSEEDEEENKEEGDAKEGEDDDAEKAEGDEDEEGEDEGEEKAENESIASNEEGTSNAKETTDKSALDAEEEEDPSNLQLSWEMLELAKHCFQRHADSLPAEDAKRMELEDKLSETYQVLGEISIENESYEQAIDDLTSCLRRRQELLPEDSRMIAETHYQMGVAYGFGLKFDEAVASLNDAIQVLTKRIENLKNKTESVDPMKKNDAFCAREKEIAEIESLLPEIHEKIADTKDMAKESVKRVGDRVLMGEGELESSSSLGGGPEGDNAKVAKAIPIKGKSSAGNGLKNGSSNGEPASDITHMLKKRKQPEEASSGENGSSETKKPHLEETPAPKEVATNGAN